MFGRQRHEHAAIWHAGIWMKRSLAAALLASTAILPAQAFEIGTGNPDLSIRWDNTVKGTAGVRAVARQGKLANVPNFDEGDYRFDRGDFVTKRIDVLSEFDVVYQRSYGFRVSGAGWYDNAYDDTTVKQNPALARAGWQSSYFGNEYSNTTKRFYRGPSGEILDAFAFGKLDLGPSPLNFKIGQHTISWGTSTFDAFQNGIAYGQAPVDGRKGAAVPGSTLKEVLLPVPQVSAQWQVAPQVSLAGQMLLGWKPSRFPEGGTYLGAADLFFIGPDRAPLAPGLAVPRNSPLTPKKAFNGSYGVSAAWSPTMLEGGSVTAYYRQFDDVTPWLTPQIRFNQVGTANVPASARLVYPKNIRMPGMSLNFDVMGASVGVDLSYRNNAPLAATGVSTVDNEGPRGNTGHLNVNFVKALPPLPLYDTGTMIAELSYQHLFSVTKHAELFNGVGYGSCVNGTRTGPGSKWDGCATRNFVGLAVQFNPQWLQVVPGIDLTMPITANYGLLGNGATSLSGKERAYSYSVGLQADIRQTYKATLAWAQSHADVHDVVNGAAVSGNGSYAGNDRGWVSLSLQTTF